MTLTGEQLEPDTNVWQEIGRQIVNSAELGFEYVMITQRMKLGFGWRVMVTNHWKDRDGILQIRTQTFNAVDNVHRWTPTQWDEAEAVFSPPEQETPAKEK